MNTIHNLHVLEGLKKLPDQSIDMVMTSPPYWSLRDYGKQTDVIWGGNSKCKHKFRGEIKLKKTSGGIETAKVMNNKKVRALTYSSKFCSKCEAWKGQLGLEPTVDLFIDHLVEIFDEVKRVLKNTGTCWVNLGDTYNAGRNGGHAGGNKCSWGYNNLEVYPKQSGVNAEGLLPKSLCLIPYRFAIAMVNKGWILRNVIIWHKPNCLPSSAKDRFTVDFEYLFFFSKSKKYYFERQLENFNRRNKRCIWSVNTKPFKEAHFAVFPEALCEIPIRAGCPEKVCIKCGMPKLQNIKGGNPAAINYRVRDVKNGKIKHINRKASAEELESSQIDKYTSRLKVKNILGCQCNAGYNAGIVLDPFIGSGTTAVVAKKLKRNYIGFELNPDYVRIAKKRMEYIDGAENTKS